MEKKIRIAFIYKDCLGLSERNFFTQHRNLLLKALARNNDVDVKYYLCDKNFDVAKIQDQVDAIILYEDQNIWANCVPDELSGIKDSGIPVIVKIGDPWDGTKYDVKASKEKYKIDGYFGTYATEFFYKYYPKNFNYKCILYGVEPSLYENVIPFEDRIKDRILNSGAIASTKFTNRIFAKLTKGEGNPIKHYKLRTLCNNLTYVDYTTTLGHEFIGDKYPLLLQKYASAIAATTDIYTMKYFEMPAAGCLTFMEVTENNYAQNLGYRDGESAIFINEKNYEEKFQEYLSDISNPKWKEIAMLGREHALKNFNNDKGIVALVDYVKEFL